MSDKMKKGILYSLAGMGLALLLFLFAGMLSFLAVMIVFVLKLALVLAIFGAIGYAVVNMIKHARKK